MPNAIRNKRKPSEEEAEIFRLYDTGLTDKEIAKRLNLPVASVRARKAHRTIGTYDDVNMEVRGIETISKFTWIPIYTELAEKILAYRSHQAELLDIIKKLKKQGQKLISVDDKNAPLQASISLHSTSLGFCSYWVTATKPA